MSTTTTLVVGEPSLTDPRAEEFRRLISMAPEARTSGAFFKGDHWQGGDGWIGPKVSTDGVEGGSEIMADIEAAFTSSNRIAEIIERHTVGLVGREPVFSFTPRRPMKANEKPTSEEQRLIDEAEAEMTVWWNERGAHQVFQHAVATLLWADRAPLRLFVPGRFLTPTGRVYADGSEQKVLRAASITEALSYVYPDAPAPEDATVWVHPHDRTPVGVFTYLPLGRTPGDEVMEVSFHHVPSNRTAILRFESLAAQNFLTATLNIGDRIPMYEMTRETFVTPQIKQQQRALNLALSMLPRNVVTGGFLERIILNGMMPGRWQTDAEGNRIAYLPDPNYRAGAGTTNFIQGVDYTETDLDGRERTKIANPSVVFREPVDVLPTIRAAENLYKSILEEADQAHILIQGEAVASGKSREQARADFISSLGLSARAVEEAGRWKLETALAMAENFSGRPGYYTSRLRAVFKCRLDSGPLSADEKRQVQESAEKNYLSRESAMEQMGTDDVDAENARIASEEGWKLGLLDRQAKTLSALLAAGYPPDVAVAEVGIPEPIRQKVIDNIVAKQEAEAERQASSQPPTS